MSKYKKEMPMQYMSHYEIVLNEPLADHDMEVNYDINFHILLHGNWNIIVKNLLDWSLPSWSYSSRLHNDSRMKFYRDVRESRLVITKVHQAEDAGKHGCSSDHEYNGKTIRANRTIEVIVNEIKDGIVEEKMEDYLKLFRILHGNHLSTVTWKIDFDNEDLNPKTESPDDCWVALDPKVVVDKSEGRWTLKTFKGVKNAELIIANATDNENGYYTCCAKNLVFDCFQGYTVTFERGAAGAVEDNLIGGITALLVLASFVVISIEILLLWIKEVFTCSKFRYYGKKITFLLTSLFFIFHPIAAAADPEIEVNYDIGNYKLLHVNQTLELICKNMLNRSPPSWTYSSRLYRDPRMKLSQDVGESRLVINNAQAEDAGQYGCSSDHEYNGKTFHYNRTIEVIVNEIKDVKVEEEKDSIKLLCNVQAYPSATITWKIDYDNKELNTQPEEPDLEDEYWVPPSDDYYRVVVDKTEGRFTLRPYKGVNNAELIITDVTEDDIGKYYCFARNLAGEICKECNVTRPKRGVAVEVEGLGGGTITLIVLASFFALGCVLGASITLYRKKQHQKKEEKQKESQESRSLPLIERNGASKA